MKNSKLQLVALRQKAVWIPEDAITDPEEKELSGATSTLAANFAKLGFGVSEKLLRTLNRVRPTFQADLLEQLKQVTGVNKNWTPLVKGWDVPTGESLVDHIMTFFANIFGARGIRLQCGHIIPPGTFPLERYNGCPFCGTPFEFGEIENYGQGSKLKVLELWTEKELNQFFRDLLLSKTALDATQIDSLKILLTELPLPEVSIGMKETSMTVIDTLIAKEETEKVRRFLTSPTDLLRYLWYKHTGFLQVIEPKTIIKRKKNNSRHVTFFLDQSGQAKLEAKTALKLKYSRKESIVYARLLNEMELPVEKMCEMMHPKRGMWIRFIRALRLAEYSKRPGFEKLKELLDVFYQQKYSVWQGRVEHFRLRSDAENTMKLLKQRPGLFARSLFANMLWFGLEPALTAFEEILDKVPVRLVLTLAMYADLYFDKENSRTVKPLGGVSKNIPANKLLSLYNEEQLEGMKNALTKLCMDMMKKRFAAIENPNRTIYIDSLLFKMPLAIGDRSENVQDLPSSLTGTRFPVEGDTIRLFMQWGTGLAAQHLDMDLSCSVAYEEKMDFCSYSNLVTKGCKHSGDIREIPEKLGTAEYIEINLDQLIEANALYVAFTCNAYSVGALTPNLVVGWMNSLHPMKISPATGVAYDPSCVQHQVRISQSLTKGLVFGVLDVQKREIVWLEMPFAGQVVQELNVRGVRTLLKKLDSKFSIGYLLKVKAEAQGLLLTETPDADENYDPKWAINTAAVTQLLVDKITETDEVKK